MSELKREAFRRYKRQQERDQANAYGRAKAEQIGITEAYVIRLIKEFRAEEPVRKEAGQRRRKTALDRYGLRQQYLHLRDRFRWNSA